MSTAKVIFTYKRKRLSSCSGVGHADASADFSLDVQEDKHQDAPNEKIKSPEKVLKNCKSVNCNDVDCTMDRRSCLEPFNNQHTDFQLQHVCHGEEIPAACLSPALNNSNRLGEEYDVQRSDTTDTRKMVLASHELPGDDTFKISGEHISAEASLGETTNSIKKCSCSLHSSYLDVERCMQDGSVSQSVEKDSNILSKPSDVCKTEVAKGNSSVPLRTFSRRLKRKADECGAGMCTKFPFRERDTVIKECDSGPVPSCTCEVASKDNSLVEKSLDMKIKSNDVENMNVPCQSCDKMSSSGIKDSSCPCGQSCEENLIMRKSEKTSNTQEDLVVDTSPDNQAAIKTSGSIPFAFHYFDVIGSTDIQKDDVRCSSYDETGAASCNLACKTDKQPVSQRRASSGDSQLTSDSSDLKNGAAKRVEHRGRRSNSLDLSCPPPGVCAIDCNVVPESYVQEEASDIIQDSSTVINSEKVAQDGNMKSKGFELFGDDSGQVEDSSNGVHTSIKTKIKPKSTCLQLFAEDVKTSQITPSSTLFENGYSQAQQNVACVLDSQRQASTVIGSSLPTRPIHEGQSSKDAPTTHLFQNCNFRTCDYKQNPVQSFPDQASVRHKLLLDSINTKATSLRGNRNISLDKFEPCPDMWSDEELDSLWIGLRRHGRGNWHAMLLDPRLRFAPWRTAADLEGQWGREQYKLFSGQHVPSSRNLKPQDAYNLHCHGPVGCHGTGVRRENVAAETQLSLGDMYAKNDAVFSRSSALSYGIAQAHRHVTMASSVGSYLFNNVQASVMIRGVSSDGPAMALGMNNCLPHWLKDPISTPSRPFNPPLPPISTLPPMGGHRLVHAFPETAGTTCKRKNPVNIKPACLHPLSHQYGNPLTNKPDLANNLIVIDSDASSEETISDDANVRSN
ncbi:uncharacterized protein LOC110736479 [Chenopodium quinoa]|uniref:Uncharacterized protein n=1 Tax=Chenopodium quinoa TaxID=63459 RepID=A0A803KMW6_CHEQI|nr:uncharacterized protein LOC110736479 [Chenopodium quinoa]